MTPFKCETPYTRSHIKRDFTRSVREFSTGPVDAEKPCNYYPDLESAANLYVSTLAYHKQQQQQRKSNGSTCGFPTPSETEIPQLQAHCVQAIYTSRKAWVLLMVMLIRRKVVEIAATRRTGTMSRLSVVTEVSLYPCKCLWFHETSTNGRTGTGIVGGS